jgi:hypothetical protein
MSHTLPPEEAITALAGHTFPGGSYTIAHWESVLLADCTGVPPLPDGMVHPIALFHVPFLGGGTSIAELFALGRAESDLSIMIESYDWEFFAPLHEDVEYTISGGITSAGRCRTEQGRVYDRIGFRFELASGGETVARSEITWHFTRNTL